MKKLYSTPIVELLALDANDILATTGSPAGFATAVDETDGWNDLGGLF